MFACKVGRGTAETASTERLQEDSTVANLMRGGADYDRKYTFGGQ